MGIGQIGAGFVQKANAWVKAGGKTSVLQTKPNVGFNFKDLKYLPLKDKNQATDVAYHGSPFSFDFFDASKFGSGEGINKYGKGLYISRSKKLTPFYANIRSKDAPLHFGNTKKMDNPQPTVYY